MNSVPVWLEPIACLEDFDGDVSKYLAHIFSIFTRDFITTSPVYKNKKVLHDKKDDGGKPATFVHITTEEDRTTKERVLCLRRCERIGWIKSIIENAHDPAVLVWEKEQTSTKRRTIRTYLFLEQEDFLVIIEELKHGCFMITAIYVDYPHQKRKHLKDYEAYKKRNKQ